MLSLSLSLILKSISLIRERERERMPHHIISCSERTDEDTRETCSRDKTFI